MHYFSVCLLSALLASMTYSLTDSNLLLNRQEPDVSIFDNFDASYPTDQLVSDSPPNVALDGFPVDDLSMTLASSSPDLQSSDLFASSTPDPNGPSDDFLVAADSSKCATSNFDKIHARAELSCDGNTLGDDQKYNALSYLLYEESGKKWCSENMVAGFGNIPVCAESVVQDEDQELVHFFHQLKSVDMNPLQPPETPFVNLQTCTLSKFFYFTYSWCS